MLFREVNKFQIHNLDLIQIFLPKFKKIKNNLKIPQDNLHK
jgi:hypothetical protein